MFKIRRYYKSYILFIIILLSASCSHNKGNFSIKGSLKSIKGNYFLAEYEYKDSTCIDTIKTDNEGNFSFNGSTDTLRVMSLYFNKNKQNTYLFIDKNLNVKVLGDVKHPDLIQISGGNINNDLTAFKQANKELLMKRDRLLESSQQFSIDNMESLLNCSPSDKDMNDKDSCACFRRDSINNLLATNDSLAKMMRELVVDLKDVNFKLKTTAADYIEKNPSKIASVLLLSNFFKNESSAERLGEMLDKLKGPAADYPRTESLRRYSNNLKKSAVGSYAPDFRLKDHKQKNINLFDYSGNYVLLQFISAKSKTWERDKKLTIAAYKQLNKLLAKQKIDKKDKSKKRPSLKIVCIIKDIENYPQLNKKLIPEVSWPIILVHGGWSQSTFTAYNVHSTPYNILIGPDHKIMARNMPFFSLSETLQYQILGSKENNRTKTLTSF